MRTTQYLYILMQAKNRINVLIESDSLLCSIKYKLYVYNIKTTIIIITLLKLFSNTVFIINILCSNYSNELSSTESVLVYQWSLIYSIHWTRTPTMSSMNPTNVIIFSCHVFSFCKEFSHACSDQLNPLSRSSYLYNACSI